MSMTGLDVLDTAVSETNAWIDEVMAELRWKDRHKAYMGMRTTLQAVRDCLPVADVVRFGMQLPLLMRGFYYEGWKPSRKPPAEQDTAACLTPIHNYFGIDTQDVVRAVLTVLSRHVPADTLEAITSLLPQTLQELGSHEGKGIL